MADIWALGEKAGALLVARGERVAVSESSSGGLISAALLAVPGASSFYLGGGVIYTPRAIFGLLGADKEDIRARGIRSSSEPYARFVAETVRVRVRSDWGLSETGAAGPSGNPYGDPAGHSCVAVVGAVTASRTLRTGSNDRRANMHAFAAGALSLFIEVLERR
ncbi:MAG: nicotinamide-nucleotide amidohydrolase family protein [Alphaproteobacteria bacterium]|nr:nicotinamide-nucleotide amidohydrolase family protein [Alphaproteobacteria bacterium]